MPIDSSTGRAKYEEIIQAPGSAGELLARARTWAAKTYEASNDAIQHYDLAAGVLVIRGITPVTYSELQQAFGARTARIVDIHHTLTIEAREGRIKLTFDNLQTQQSGSQSRFDYVPSPRNDLDAVVWQESTLSRRYPNNPNWVKKNAPIYLANSRALDQAIYARLVSLSVDLRRALKLKDKDW
jgi:hypothetical protein